MKLEFFQQISKNTKISHFMKIRPGVVPCGETDRTDMTKLTIALRNFANAPKNYLTDNMSGVYIRAHVRKTEVVECWKIDLINTGDGRKIREKVRDVNSVLRTSIKREVR
jgi:hypothetical protein